MLLCSAVEVGDVLVVTLEETSHQGDDRQATYRESLYQNIQERVDPRLAIDLGRLDYMSSADFGFLISVRRRLDAKKGRMVLYAVNTYILDSLANMKLLNFFEIADDQAAALGRLTA